MKAGARQALLPSVVWCVCGACAPVGGPAPGAVPGPPPPASVEPTPATPAPPAATATSAAPCPADPRQVMLDAINLLRGDRGLPTLRPEPRLYATAEAHALDLLRHGLQGHEGSDGSLPQDRATRAGYPWILIGENVATGFGSASAVVAGWMASPPHRANLLTPDFREVGIANQPGEGTAGPVWVLVLGRRRAAAQDPPGCADGSRGAPGSGSTGL